MSVVRVSHKPHKDGLSVDVRVGETLVVDSGRITITVDAKSGQLARLRICGACNVQRQEKRVAVPL